jgi:hypothetical protein
MTIETLFPVLYAVGFALGIVANICTILLTLRELQDS